MNKSAVWIVVVLLVVVVLAGVYFTRDSGESIDNKGSDVIVDDSDNVVEDADNGMDDEDGNNLVADDSDSMIDDDMMGEPDVTFVLTGENFRFMMNGEDNPDLVVNEGDLVRVEFTSTSGFHDWVVDEFDASTEQVMGGEDGMTYVEFVADQAGEFEYYCSVGQHRANGMKGKLIVQ